MSNNVLKIFIERDKSSRISDAIAVHSILSIAKNVNEDITMGRLSPDSLTTLLLKLLGKINFGKDLEQMLNLYTEIRASFGNISDVVSYLVNILFYN